MATTARAATQTAAAPLNLPFIIGASSVGTLIEWYDFYLYGVLALFFSKHFFAPTMDQNLAFILGLAGAVPDLGRAGRAVDLHPAEARGIAALCAAQGAGQGFGQSGAGKLQQRQELGPDPVRAVRRHGARGRGLVHRPVLRAVLH